MVENIDIFSLANQGLKFTESLDSTIKCAEMFFSINEYINIEIEENSIKNSEIGCDYGSSIRIIDKRGSLGFAYTNILEKDSIDKIIKTAVKMMRGGTEDPDFKNFPSKFETYPTVKDLFDPNLKELSIEDSISYVKDLIQVCEDDELAISQSANFISSYSKQFIFNTNGIEINGKETICSISSNIIVKDKISEQTSFGYEWQSFRNLKDIKTTKIAKSALKDAKSNLDRKKIKNMRVPLILTPKGTISLILNPIASATNAETFQHNRSFLVGKRNEIIGSAEFSIDDNALLDGYSGSSIFDGEGIPCKHNKIIENGKFVQILHNSYTAGKEGVESTGNATRSSYSEVPSIGITNLIMKNGTFSKDELIKDIKQGILLDYTGDQPNIATGDFSGLILHGNLIIDGEIKHSLNETMIGINMLELIQKIEGISKNYKIYGAYQAPYVKIADVQIIGSAH